MKSKTGRNGHHIRQGIDEHRDEILAYLRAHSRGRQGQIAKEVGVRREAICYYANGRELNDVRLLKRLQRWMWRDQERLS